MTREVLPSDVECAEKFLKAGCDPASIIAALEQRGLEETDAVRLIQQLIRGEIIKPSTCFITPTRQHHVRRTRHAHREETFNFRLVLFVLAITGIGLYWLATFLISMGNPPPNNNHVPIVDTGKTADEGARPTNVDSARRSR